MQTSVLEILKRKKWVKFLVGWLVFLSLVAVVVLAKAKIAVAPGQQTPLFKRFASEEEFKKFVAGAHDRQAALPGAGAEFSQELPARQNLKAPTQPGRFSQTNVQVIGIDEPDIVKTDGRNLFLSSPGHLPYILDSRPLLGMPKTPPEVVGATQVVQAFPVTEMAKLAKIDRQGELLLVGTRLLILSQDAVSGFDITDPKNPKEVWKLKYEGGGHLVSARLYKEKVYLATASSLNFDNPCPVPLLSGGSTKLAIPCRDIYYPTQTNLVDTIFSVVSLDPETGGDLGTTTFLASSYSSVVYMSTNAIYVTYPVEPDYVALYLNFFETTGRNLVPASLVDRVRNLQSLDISSQAKLVEYNVLYQNYLASLSPDARLKFTNEFENKFADFTKENLRKFSTSAVTKINLADLSFVANTLVPGTILSQFSVDEYKSNLRVATTTSPLGGPGSTNDVYILDSRLNEIGSIKDLGLSEQIYSVRFVGDTAYVVTFRQTDPFFVLDLANPRNPVKAGELKIPGFSSYLDPLEDGLILGVGQEGGKVKLSLFDVSNPRNPLEFTKYNLDDYWTEVSSNHHAFLADTKHKVFFLPGGKGGYVFSYDGRELTLKQVVADMAAQRAVYINDYLYVIGADKIVVLDENTWQTVASLVL